MIDLVNRMDTFMEKRGITGHVSAERFVHDFKTNMVYFAVILGESHAEYLIHETLSLLEDDDNLTDSSILNTNFRCTIDDLISPALRENKLFMETFSILLNNNGKGVGAGELALPLILSNYRFSNVSDGEFDYDGETHKVEIKKDGASLKPVKTGLTEKGLVDRLTKKYFNSTVPGMKAKKDFEKHLATVTDPTVYGEFFEQLYVGCNTKDLTKTVVDGAYKDAVQFQTAVGKFALREYKKVDGWNNIMYIDVEKRKVVNICDVNNVDELGLKFAPKFKRGRDTQAIADGYVNVKI